MKLATNGPRTAKQASIAQARLRILKLAQEQGFITNKQAKKVARLNQVWFHLAALEKAGYLRHTDYNEWKPKRGRPLQQVEL